MLYLFLHLPNENVGMPLLGTPTFIIEPKIDEDGIQGNASIRLTGTIYEKSEGLTIEGIKRVSMQVDGETMIRKAISA